MNEYTVGPEAWNYHWFRHGDWYVRKINPSEWIQGGSEGKISGGAFVGRKDSPLYRFVVPSISLPITVLRAHVVIYVAQSSHKNWSSYPPGDVSWIAHFSPNPPDKEWYWNIPVWDIPVRHVLGGIPPGTFRERLTFSIPPASFQEFLNAGHRYLWISVCKDYPWAPDNAFGRHDTWRGQDCLFFQVDETPPAPARVGIRWLSASQFKVMWTDVPRDWKESWIVEKEVDQSGTWTRIATIREGPEYWERFWIDTAIHLNRRYRYRVATQLRGKLSAFTYSPIIWSYPMPTGSGLTDQFWTSADGTVWTGPYPDLTECRKSRYLKWKGELSVDPSLNPDAANFSPALFSKQILYRG
ncbi:TPA: hypothetical protein DCX15_00970 [bacterium]|nr:hypothetical protein [bacterium]